MTLVLGQLAALAACVTVPCQCKKAKGFVLEDSQALKKVPKGFPADSPWAEYLKLKNPCLFKSFDDAFLLSDNLLDKTLEAYRPTVEFNNWLNKAVEYALD